MLLMRINKSAILMPTISVFKNKDIYRLIKLNQCHNDKIPAKITIIFN